MALFYKAVYTLLAFIYCVNGANILMTEVFEIVVDPPLFNWTYEGHNDQYIYMPSLLNKPDLPSWMNYVYSDRYHSGFLYGVPPYNMDREIVIEIVALNRKTYETRRTVIPIVIGEKLKPAKNEVQLKIDNLNVEDMFDADRMDRLKDVFRKQLWVDSQNDLYVTYLASAVQWGARLPLDPTEGEGVVIRIGSVAELSQDLIELQKEVKPLWRMPNCPRNFKRTKVERYFRDAGFALDWCSFRLLDENTSISELDEGTVEKLSKLGSSTDRWASVRKDNIPERNYTYEIIFSTFVPLIIMTLMAAILSLILCVQHNDFEDESSEQYFHNIFHLCTDRRNSGGGISMENESNQYSVMNSGTDTLKSCINSKDYMYFSPESMSRSHTNSPSLKSRGVHCRPSPPPYIKPTFKPDL